MLRPTQISDAIYEMDAVDAIGDTMTSVGSGENGVAFGITAEDEANTRAVVGRSFDVSADTNDGSLRAVVATNAATNAVSVTAIIGGASSASASAAPLALDVLGLRAAPAQRRYRLLATRSMRSAAAASVEALAVAHAATRRALRSGVAAVTVAAGVEHVVEGGISCRLDTSRRDARHRDYGDSSGCDRDCSGSDDGRSTAGSCCTNSSSSGRESNSEKIERRRRRRSDMEDGVRKVVAGGKEEDAASVIDQAQPPSSSGVGIESQSPLWEWVLRQCVCSVLPQVAVDAIAAGTALHAVLTSAAPASAGLVVQAEDGYISEDVQHDVGDVHELSAAAVALTGGRSPPRLTLSF